MYKYYVMMTPDMGRGVFAEKDLSPGEVVTNCEVNILSEKDTRILSHTDLRYYTFVFNEVQDCLVLGDGQIFNHSHEENVAYNLININGRFMMEFVVTRPVKRDAQLFINYNQDVEVNVNEYTVNLI